MLNNEKEQKYIRNIKIHLNNTQGGLHIPIYNRSHFESQGNKRMNKKGKEKGSSRDVELSYRSIQSLRTISLREFYWAKIKSLRNEIKIGQSEKDKK